MQQRAVGNTGLTVSRLALGTLTWGFGTDEHEAHDQLTHFVESGGTLIDTAPNYGGGAAETLLGSLIGTAVSRDDVVLASAAGVMNRRGVNVADTSRGGLLRSLDATLTRLNADYLDLWQVQAWNERIPLEETLAALDTAVASGKVRYAGIANYNGWQSAQAATWQRAVPGRTPLASHQVEYSLLARDAEAEVIPAAEALGLGVLAWAPLGRGVLTGKYRTGTPSDSRAASNEFADYVGRHLNARSHQIVEAVAAAAEGLGWTATEVALVWVRDRPGVASAVLGARSVNQLRAALATESLSLPPELIDALDDVSGGE